MKKIKCVDCGKVFETRAFNKKRCEVCQKKWHIESTRRYDERRRAARLKSSKPKIDPNVCTKVRTCIYRGKAGDMWVCNYLMIMGHKRPCGVQGCTVYKRGKRLTEVD